MIPGSWGINAFATNVNVNNYNNNNNNEMMMMMMLPTSSRYRSITLGSAIAIANEV